MTNPHVLQMVRGALATWLSNRHPGEALDCQESILIRDGFYCGRRFNFADYHAIWFVEEGHVKIFAESGELLAKIVVQQPVVTLRSRAA